MMQTYDYTPPRIGKTTQYSKPKAGFLARKRQKMKQKRGK